MFEKIRDMFAEELGINKDEIKMESDIREDLGLDSIDLMGIIDEIEESFGVHFSDDDLGVKTVGEVANLLEKMLAEKGE